MNKFSRDVDAVLAGLLEHFEQELERQETVLAVMDAQGAAAVRRDIPELERKTAALSMLLQETASAENRRLELVKDVVEAFELPVTSQTLSGLIAAAPMPWAERLAQFQERMRDVLIRVRETARHNRRLMSQSKRGVDSALEALLPCRERPAYTAGGAMATAAAGARLIDHRG